MAQKNKMLCTSCKQEIGKKGLVFKCPKCGKQEIARCLKCKKLASKYECKKCGFIGP